MTPSTRASSDSEPDEIPRVLAPERPVLDPLRDRLRARLFGGPSTTRVGRFVILRELGTGGMGQVYAAYDEQLDRKVAVKVLRPGLSRAPQHRQRLLREAQALARLSHPNVVAVYEAGEVDGQVFLVMELVRGLSLRQWQQAEPRSWRAVLGRYVDAGRGLAAAHAAGLTHRDFKPDNVLVGDDGRVRVADFGLAFAGDHASLEGLDEQERASLPPGEPTVARTLEQRLTRTGARMGTLAYMAPEQSRGEGVGPASDQYAFCVSLYEALFGERPRLGHDVEPPTLEEHARASSPEGRGRVPRWLVEALRRGLAEAPTQRHADMDALLWALTRRLGRRRRWGASSIAVGLVVAGWLARPTPEPLCAAAGEELTEIWDDERREALRAAFEATGLDFAERTGQRATRELDAYARAWAEARVDACEATHVRRVQSSEALDLRTACLDGRRRELVALVDALGRVDATGVIKASEAVSGLPPVGACGDLEALRRGVSPPPPGSEGEVGELRRALAEVRSAASLGDYVRAQRRLGPVLERARTLGYGPLLAEVLHVQGSVSSQRGELEPAREALLEAVDLAESHRHDEVAALAWRDLSYLGAVLLRDPTASKRWLRRAWAAVRRRGSHPLDEASVLEQQGHLARLRHDFDEAERSYREALERREAALGSDHHKVVNSRATLANNHMVRGALAEARAEYQQVVAKLTQMLGPDHPEVGAQRFNLALVLQKQGQLDRADEHLAATLAIYRDAYGERSTRLVPLLNKRAELEGHRGRLDVALDLAEQARSLLDTSAAEPLVSPALLETISVIGILQYRQRQWDEALRSFIRFVELVEAGPEPSPVHRGLGHSNVGDVLVAMERWDEAAARFERALGLLRPVLSPDHPHLGAPLRGIGQARLGRGDAAGAVEPLRRSLAIRRAHPGDRHELALTQWALARALARSTPAETDEALALAREARDLFVDSGDPTASAEVDDWIRTLDPPPDTP